MAAVKLSGGYQKHPEGNFDFQITKVDESSMKYNKLEVTMVDAQNRELIQRYDLNTEGGLLAFSFLVKGALNDWELEEIPDTQLIVGEFINCNVVHSKINDKDDPSKVKTYVNIRDIESSDGWDGKSITPVTESTANTSVVPDLSFLK